MNRIEFFDSVSGIDYPDMIVHFFDHFIALKQLVEDNGKIYVTDCTDDKIGFEICFNNTISKDSALAMINSLGGTIVIYNRPINVTIDSVTECSVKINLI